MDVETNREAPTTTLRLSDAAKSRLRELKDRYRITQTEIINAALLKFDCAQYMRDRIDQAERQAA